MYAGEIFSFTLSAPSNLFRQLNGATRFRSKVPSLTSHPIYVSPFDL